jgi:hypothetical protein
MKAIYYQIYSVHMITDFDLRNLFIVLQKENTE